LYIDALYDRQKDVVKVVERIKGERVYNEITPEHVFYFEHPSGSHQTIFGNNCKKFVSRSGKNFRRDLAKMGATRRIFESDINPVFRTLADNYRGVATPKLNVAFFDIEVEFSLESGFAPVTDPFNRVNAISVYCNWLDKLICLVLCPPTFTTEDAEAITSSFEDTFLFDDEGELLKCFMNIIEDADITSTWNGDYFDWPYLVNRITRTLGEDYTRAFCLWDQKPIKKIAPDKFGNDRLTFEFPGRPHLDYLRLYQKHNPQQLHSYRLDYVGEIETGENKVAYEGTLDELWKKDFRRFIEYSRQDTMLLPKIDAKKKFIELSNQIAHGNCVLFKTTLGSVALVEQAIILEMHDMGFIVPDRKRTTDERAGIDTDDDPDEERTPVVGAYVADPKIGLHEEFACCDINSLYPSAIRALNMSPETVWGQFRADETNAYIAEKVLELGDAKRAQAWDGIFHSFEFGHIAARDGAALTVDLEDGTSRTMSGRDWYDYIFNPKNHLCVTANGTIFRTNKDGMIPMLLAKWYAERKQMQKEEEKFYDLTEAETDPDKKAEYKALTVFWNQRQQARKILLNSLYGALLNEGLRFYDERVGQSVTLTGRSIVRHMNAKVNEVITGKYDYKGDSIIYADTDSCYFSAYHLLKDHPDYADFVWSRENIIELYDMIADVVNDSFPEFMHRTFNTTIERGAIIKAGRELVASKGLFIKKKKYACLMYDKENKRLDKGNSPGKLKAMGLDLKRADTPKFMQSFLEKLLMSLLTGENQQDMFNAIREFRRAFVDRPGWEKGTPKAVKAMSKYGDEYALSHATKATDSMKKGQKGSKVNLPGHVRAALNWNHLCETFGDRYSMRIGDGSKVIVCKLKTNVLKMDSVAYPIDEPHIPEWFKQLPFDHELMEETIIDNKLENLVGVLNWDLSQTKDVAAEDFFVFSK
jgi:DNA polymerase elongation subunit (family B)